VVSAELLAALRAGPGRGDRVEPGIAQDRPGSSRSLGQRPALLLVRARPRHLSGVEPTAIGSSRPALRSTEAGRAFETSSPKGSSGGPGSLGQAAELSRTARSGDRLPRAPRHIEGVPLERARAESLRRLRALRPPAGPGSGATRACRIRADGATLLQRCMPSRPTPPRPGRATLMSMLTLVKYQARERLPGRARRQEVDAGAEEMSRHSHDHRASGTDRVGELARHCASPTPVSGRTAPFCECGLGERSAWSCATRTEAVPRRVGRPSLLRALGHRAGSCPAHKSHRDRRGRAPGRGCQQRRVRVCQVSVEMAA